MKIKHISLFIILLVSVAGLFAQGTEKDAMFRDVVIEYHLNEDGSTVYHYAHKLKLLTNNAFRRQYGETFIVYNPEHQKLTVNKSETTMADGKKINSPENAYNKVLPRFCQDAPAYNHLREMVVTHTGIEIGAEIALDYTIETKPGFLPGLMGQEVLDNSSPIKNAVIRVKIPSTKKLYFKLYNHETKETVVSEGNFKVYEWKFENLPAVYPERNLPVHGSFAPRLVFSEFNDMNEVANIIKNQPAFREDLNKEMEVFVHTLQAETTFDQEFIVKLQNKLAAEFTTYHIPFDYIGHTIRTPQEIWNSSAGTELEKAVLLGALLKKAGFVAEPVLVSNLDMAENAPCLTSIDNVMLRTEINGQCTVLPVDQAMSVHFPYQAAGKTIALLKETATEIKKLPRVKAAENIAQLSAVLKVEEAMMTGKAALTLSGAANPYFSFINDQNKLKALIKNTFNSADPGNFNIESLSKTKLSASASVKIENPFKEQGDYLFWTVPNTPNGFASWHMAALSVDRLQPFALPHSLNEESKISIELTKGMRLVTPQKKIKIDNNVGSVAIKIEEAHGVVQITRNLALNKSFIPVSEYKDLLELWQLWQNPAYRELCFKK